MKKVEAFVRHEAFEPIRMELLALGFPSLSIMEVKGSGRQRARAEARHDDGNGAAGGLGGELGHAGQPLASEDRVHHLQMHGPEPLHQGGRLRHSACVHGYCATVAASGCACRTSSPASPVRTL